MQYCMHVHSWAEWCIPGSWILCIHGSEWVHSLVVHIFMGVAAGLC